MNIQEWLRLDSPQMALVNTNSRYLHGNINILAQELLENVLPEALSVVHFVNSGSEANEFGHSYGQGCHWGNKILSLQKLAITAIPTVCIDISAYKFNGKGGNGAPEHTHIFPLPDTFRGKYRGKNTGPLYAREVQQQITKIQKKGRGVSAFIVEPIISLRRAN